MSFFNVTGQGQGQNIGISGPYKTESRFICISDNICGENNFTRYGSLVVNDRPDCYIENCNSSNSKITNFVGLYHIGAQTAHYEVNQMNFIGNISNSNASVIGLSSPDVNDRNNKIKFMNIKDFQSSLGIISSYITYVRLQDCYIINCQGKLIYHGIESQASFYFDKTHFTDIKPSYETDPFIKQMNADEIQQDEVNLEWNCNNQYHDHVKSCAGQTNLIFNIKPYMYLVIILM